MADSPLSNDTPLISHFSCFLPTVSLYDWWLVIAKNDFEGKRLAVAGVSSRKKEAIRVFISAPIVKRYDVFSLKTADGVHVIISGFINERRTLENGFAPEVFNSFVFGFPPNWESYALDCHREESKAGTGSGNSDMDKEEGIPTSDNVSTICPEILSNEKSVPSSLVLPDEGLENCRKPLPEDECSASKEMSGINAAYGRLSGRLHKHNIKVCRKKKQPTAGSPPKHPDKDQSTTSVALENCDGGLESPSTPIQSQSRGLLNKLSEQLQLDKKSASRFARTLSAKTEGCNKKKKRMAKTEVVSPKRKIIKHASSVKSPQERDVSCLDNGSKQNISLVSPEQSSLRKPRSGLFGEKSKAGTDSGNAVTDNEESIPPSDNISTICPEIFSDGAEKSIPIFIFPEEGPGNREKPLPGDECNVLKEICGADVAFGSGRNRRSARLHKHGFEVFQQKQQPATESSPKHPDKDQSSTSAALENCDAGMESPSAPSQSQSKGLLNTSEQLVKKSASRISRTLSAKTEGCNKKNRRIVKTEVVTPKRKITKPASYLESPQERDVSHLNKGSEQKISLVSPESLGLRKSRSGRLLLPRLEFWRNQIPIYNADHEVIEIQEGKSLHHLV